MQTTMPTMSEMIWRFRKKYGSSKRVSAMTKLELSTFTMPRIISTAMMPSTASMSFCQNFLRTGRDERASASSVVTDASDGFTPSAS